MIEAKHLAKDYGPFRAVDDVTFTVEPGDILGFLGPNGAGKSTTMKMLTGFLSATAGTACINGHDVFEEPRAARTSLGYLPEVGPLYQEMTVREFLSFIARIRGMDSSVSVHCIHRAVESCNLHSVMGQTMDTLSKGFRQRVGLAQAILHDPSCLIMDEPTDGLDPNQKDEVRSFIASMAQDKAIILSTHILEEVSAMCNRVIIINRGRMLVDERPDDLLKRHPRYNCLSVTGESDAIGQLADALNGGDNVLKVERSEPNLLTLEPRDQVDLRPVVLSMASEKNLKLDAVEREEVRLEDVFRALTQRAA
ncbi:MAG: ATP-binding cassette domain-containing protein [Opitutales bacterium]|nr:ATP-binding cassette domain-containing protein [Opitutales bacterium]NRA26101.1 ATP-binding cassette domain-containing protein [Opitutales bacterium]